MALWGYQLYFPSSPNKSSLLVFILSPAIQYELFTLHFPEIVEAIGMFVAKNTQSIMLKQDALSLVIPFGISFGLPVFSKAHI